MLPYGLERNRKGIEYSLRYATEQGLAPRIHDPAEISPDEGRGDGPQRWQL